MSEQYQATVILPVKPEGEPYLNTLVQDLEKYNLEILVETGRGLGHAVRNGIEKASNDMIIIMDTDGSYSPRDIPRFIENLEENLMVIGSKYLTIDEFVGHDGRSPIRKIVTKTFNKLVNKLLKINLTDPLSGYFGIRKELVENIDLDCEGFKIGLEILHKTGVEAKEIPIKMKKRVSGGMDGIHIKEGVRLLSQILSYRFSEYSKK
jgi:glycosyltransferase involved in cell wall biosynthesis